MTTGSANYLKWGLQEGYDRYGNRLSQTAISGCTPNTCPQASLSVDSTTNRINSSGFSHDAAGNMTNDAVNTLTYDGNSHLTKSVNGSNSGTYTYNGKGLRVTKASTVSSTTTTTVYVFSGSKVIAEYDNGAAVASPSREYIYSGGVMIAKIDSTGTKYYHRDHLSNRVITDVSGNIVAQMGHYPFGETWYNASSDKLIFTTYERDAESGNDYAMDRTYINRLGRFSSVDPVGGNISNPQSLNRYTYALNDPINIFDPTGDDGISDYCAAHGDICSHFGGGGGGGGGGMGPVCYSYGLEIDCGTALNWLNPGDGSLLSLISIPTLYWHPGDSHVWIPIEWGYVGIAGLFSLEPDPGRNQRTTGNGQPIYCLPDVIEAMKRAWTATGNGSLGTEAGFTLNGDYNSFMIEDMKSGNTRGYQQMTIPGACQRV